jgi:hypothetical protein
MWKFLKFKECNFFIFLEFLKNFFKMLLIVANHFSLKNYYSI